MLIDLNGVAQPAMGKRTRNTAERLPSEVAKRIIFPPERPAQVTSSCERLLAVPNALGHFRYGARALRDLVLNLDVGRKRPLLLLHQLQDLLERRPSHAPRYVRPIGGPVLQDSDTHLTPRDRQVQRSPARSLFFRGHLTQPHDLVLLSITVIGNT